MNQLQSKINIRSEDFKTNQTAMQNLVDDLSKKSKKLLWVVVKLHAKNIWHRGKLLPRERIDHLIHPGTAFLEIGQLAASRCIRMMFLRRV